MTPEFVVIHNTANRASAKNEIAYMHSNSNEVSFHFAVDDVEAIRGIPLNRNAWHASDGANGRGNRKGIAIEICYSYCEDESTWKQLYKSKFEKSQENAAELVAYLLHTYGWGMDTSRIKKHADFTNKHCPHRTLDTYGWDYFIELVKSKYNSMYNDAPKAEVTNSDSYDTIESCPDYAQATIKKLVSKGYLKGNDENKLDLSKDMIRIFVILDRAGVFG